MVTLAFNHGGAIKNLNLYRNRQMMNCQCVFIFTLWRKITAIDWFLIDFETSHGSIPKEINLSCHAHNALGLFIRYVKSPS